MNSRHVRIGTVLSASLILLAASAHGAETAASASAAGTGVSWETSYVSVLKRAGAEGKPILFDFHTGWCPFCTKMEKTTWIDGKVVDATKPFVAGKINCDVETVPVTRYHLTGFPTVIIADSSGEPIVRTEGYKEAATIQACLAGFAEKKDVLASALATLKKDKKNSDALLTLADFQASVGLPDQAVDGYQKVVKGSQGDVLVRAAAGAGSSLVKLGKADAAAKVLAQGVAAAGDKPSPALLLALGQCAQAQGKTDEAKGHFQRLVADHPDSPEAAEARKTL
jgi:thioredoxin-like negative regulator of GroEL